MLATVRKGICAHFPTTLVDELINAYSEAKRNFALGGLRLSAVEGGRFCEAAFRVLQQRTTGAFDPLGVSLDTERLSKQLQASPSAQHPDSVRLFLPRALRVIYDIRNNRDAAHLADGIDPNLQDATLVISVLDWVMAELVRLFHDVSANEAQKMIAGIVTRSVPVIEDIAGFLKILNPKLGASESCLVLLYQRNSFGATPEELSRWVRPSMRRNLARTLRRLEQDHAHVHNDGVRFKITIAGKRRVEQENLLEMR